MKLATILAGTAFASLAMFTPIGAPVGLSAVSTAQAQVSVSFSVFYNDLADHGDWVRYRDDYVFIPAKVERGWRPYTMGHWIYANDYGWTWASEEPFGWATYHYGRWGYGEDIGWYWVPGTRWAPAWVSWRRSNDHVVWAPLPPRRGGSDLSIEISVGDIPDFYWVAVPTRSFLDIDLRRDIIRNDRDRNRIVQRTEFIGTPRVQNNIVINTVIDIDIIQKETGKKVRRVDVRKSNDPREARATDDQVTVFEGEVKAEANAKPKRVKKVEEVAKVTREDATEQTDVQQPQNKAVPGTGTDQASDAAKTRKKNQPAQVGTEDGNATTQDTATDQADENTTKKKRKQPIQAETPTTNTGSGTEAQVEEPANGKKAKKAKADSNAETNAEQQDQASQPMKKKKQNASEDDVTTGSTDKAKNAKKDEKANKGKKKQECDPSTDASCPAQ